MLSEDTASLVFRAVIVDTIWMTRYAASHGIAGVRMIFWWRTRMSYASGAARMSGTEAAIAIGTSWNWERTTGALL